MDLHSRFIVGWALSAVNDRHLTLSALEKAIKRRCPDAGLLHDSDQGCTYASEDHRITLDAHGITCSTSRRGNGYDNAMMESWFSMMTSEGAVLDWSGVFLRELRQVDIAIAGIGYAMFSVAMIVGRLTGDRLIHGWDHSACCAAAAP
jgi:transposase InsO family protein